VLGAQEAGQGPKRLREAGQRRVLIDATPGGGRRGRARGEPALEVDARDLEPPLGAMGLGVQAPDEMAVVEDGERVA
jgi:hypothetical protein